MADTNYRDYYDLEAYLFGKVTIRFENNRQLNAFDFFCIVIWKANRAKSRIASRLLNKNGTDDLENAVADLTGRLAAAEDHKTRLKILISDWKFRLPMASAILTVLYPRDFTVYDIRVCDLLGKFHNTQDRSKFDDLWSGYQNYVDAVRQEFPKNLDLREKDKWLWGKSFYDQLNNDISTKFRSVLREMALSWIQQLEVGMKFSYGDVECYIKTHCPDDFTSTGDGYKKDAKDAVKDGIELKIIEARTGDGQFERVQEGSG